MNTVTFFYHNGRQQKISIGNSKDITIKFDEVSRSTVYVEWYNCPIKFRVEQASVVCYTIAEEIPCETELFKELEVKTPNLTLTSSTIEETHQCK